MYVPFGGSAVLEGGQQSVLPESRGSATTIVLRELVLLPEMPKPVPALDSTQASFEGGESTDETEVPGEYENAREDVSPFDDEEDDAVACTAKSASTPGMMSSTSASAV